MAEPSATFRPSWGGRLAGMEGLRALAALSVLSGHVRTQFAPSSTWGPLEPFAYVGFNGLVLFFALSGFLLFRPFATAILQGRAFPKVGSYATNRVLRIYPAYLAILVVTSVLFGLAITAAPGHGAGSTAGLIGHIDRPGLLLLDATMLQTLVPFGMQTGIGVAWSLTVELAFYVAMPLLAFVAFKAAVPRRGGSAALAAAPAAFLLILGAAGKTANAAVHANTSAIDGYFHVWGGSWSAVLARSFPVHADLFAFGMIAAVIISAIELGMVDRSRVSTIRWLAATVGIVAILAIPPISAPYEESAIGVACGALVLLTALPGAGARHNHLARVLEILPLRYVGLVSYGIYLWHLQVIWYVQRSGLAASSSGWGMARTLLLVVAISISAATITHFLVERPALRLKRRSDRLLPT